MSLVGPLWGIQNSLRKIQLIKKLFEFWIQALSATGGKNQKKLAAVQAVGHSLFPAPSFKKGKIPNLLSKIPNRVDWGIPWAIGHFTCYLLLTSRRLKNNIFAVYCLEFDLKLERVSNQQNLPRDIHFQD